MPWNPTPTLPTGNPTGLDSLVRIIHHTQRVRVRVVIDMVFAYKVGLNMRVGWFAVLASSSGAQVQDDENRFFGGEVATRLRQVLKEMFSTYGVMNMPYLKQQLRDRCDITRPNPFGRQPCAHLRGPGCLPRAVVFVLFTGADRKRTQS
jgi:hypothetical protein